jgi:hypothetical protein
MSKNSREPTGGPNDASALWLAEFKRPISERRIFKFGQIALKLSRRPGRAETDQDEAYRILDDLIAWYERHEFAEDEVLVLVDDPPRFVQIESRLDEIEREYLWRDAVMLTRAALRRYLERSTLAGAPRLLREWFPDTILPIRADDAAPADLKPHDAEKGASRRGPVAGTIDRYGKSDRALYPEIERSGLCFWLIESTDQRVVVVLTSARSKVEIETSCRCSPPGYGLEECDRAGGG